MRKIIILLILSLFLVVSFDAHGDHGRRDVNLLGKWTGTCNIVSEAGFTSLEIFTEITDQHENLFTGYMIIGNETYDIELYGTLSGNKIFATRRAQVITGKLKGKNLNIIVHETRHGIPSHGEYLWPFTASCELYRIIGR